jgi:adenosylcobinamide-phosphate synthase
MLDQLAGDPRRGHPVALFGAAAAKLESRMWRDDRAAGGCYAALLIAGPALLGLLGEQSRRLPAAGAAPGRLAPGRPAPGRLAPGRPAPGRLAPGRLAPVPLRTGWLGPVLVAGATAAGTWAVLGSRSLADEADAVAAHLRRGDLPAARQQLTHLVGRRTESLDEAEIARAAVESLAENTSDAVVAPLLWGALAGLPGLLGYRAVNTLDAMVGHHSPRYENFGWAAARADDVANYLPARLTALLTAAVAATVGGDGRAALAVARADGHRHPSPNAGVAEAAFAGALGLRLGGRNDYGSHVEDRPVLGAGGRAPRVEDIGRAARLSRAITVAAAGICAAIALAAAGNLSRASRCGVSRIRDGAI